ncbi:MAG: DeoR/GlpR transcriptional regulator [Firmicutes bacterium]|nr:DeoR/GlpR transcriptional regulator [Bacillota bacterium]
MLQYERFEIIMNKLQTQSCVRVSDLSRELGASESTIRRDIADLAREGRVKKVFGGAVPVQGRAEAAAGSASAGSTAAGSLAASSAPAGSAAGEEADGPAFAGRTVNAVSRNVEEKARLQTGEKSEVAARAAALIEDGDLVYIDAGTTTGCMIDHIDCEGASFVTNGARHAIRLARRGFRVWLLSGRLKAKTEAVIGQGAVDSLQKYHFSKCFIGTDGIDGECGLTTADIEESMVKTKAIECSQDVYILADSSKFGLVASVTFAPLGAGTIITDRLPDPDYRRRTQLIELHE